MGRNPSIIKETRRQKIHRGIRKRTLASIRDVALHRVKVKARLHTIILSGSKEYRKEYKLELLEKGLGKLWPDNGFKPEDRSGNYKLKFIRQSKYFQINVFMISRMAPGTELL